jgi:hypothetical protein
MRSAEEVKAIVAEAVRRSDKWLKKNGYKRPGDPAREVALSRVFSRNSAQVDA